MTQMLAGKTALITGAGSGIGRATTLAFAREGAWVAAADLTLDAAKRTLAEVEAAGGQGIAVQADVTDEESVAAMVQAALAAFGGLDCAFNNAGVAPGAVGGGGFKTGDLPVEAWNSLLAVNLTGVFLCLKHEVAQMRAQGGGAIVNTASIGGLVGLPGSSVYTVSKHAVVGLTRVAAADHAAENIRVNAICPGYIATAMTDPIDAARRDRLTDRVPMHRFGTPEEIAEAVVWLCSDRASYVTGAAWAADGGYTAV